MDVLVLVVPCLVIISLVLGGLIVDLGQRKAIRQEVELNKNELKTTLERIATVHNDLINQVEDCKNRLNAFEMRLKGKV